MKISFYLCALLLFIDLCTLPIHADVTANEPLKLGSTPHLFVDHYLLEELGELKLKLQQPKAQEVVLVTDQPWEGNTCAYYTVFQDGDLYRMYYRGSHWDTTLKESTHPEVVCYAESRDGTHWHKPNLGICEYEGSKQNNIVWDGIGSHNFTPFLDTNPECPAKSRFKALGRGRSLRPGDQESEHGLFAFQSPDGLHWELMHDEPVITEGAFDSQNLAFFDAKTGKYREYHRWFNKGVRDIMLCTSEDFINWTNPKGLNYGQAKPEHLYTNAITPYFRSPDLYIGFPTRYLPNEGQRVEPIFMSSRDGRNFSRWNDPLIPEDAPEDRNGNRSNYMANGILQLPRQPEELSVYASEAYYTGPDSRLRRFTFRLDGFSSLHSNKKPGVAITKEFAIEHSELWINFKTSDIGEIRISIIDPDGKPLDGFNQDQCIPMRGDHIAYQVKWKTHDNLSSLIGKSARIQIKMSDSDLYSMQFRDPR